MYPITEAVKALFESNQTKVLRVTGSTVKKLPTNISVYSGNDLVYQSGDGKLLKLYSGSTEIFDSQGTKTVILYSGDKPIFINDEAGMPIQIEITSDNVRESSFFIDRYSCNGEKLEIGTAIASELNLKLDNAEGQFDGVVFEGAELFVEIGIADWTQANPEITYIPCGHFTPDQQPRSLTTITIEALDRMTKFDAVVDATALTFPTTVSGLAGQVCTACGMTLATDLSGLPNASVSIAKLPSVNNVITYRNLIQWCAGIMATNAWVDWNGELRFSWYNNATNYVSTIDNRFTSDLYEEDLTITGAEYTNDSGIVLIEGSDDYSIDMSGNALAKDIIATVLPAVNAALNGYAYRPFTASVINAPYLWPMDVVVFKDKNGYNHNGAVTNVGFGLNGSTALESKGLTFKLNKMTAPSGVTRETAQFVNRVTQAAVDGLDDELTQQEIFNRLTDNGAAQGLVLYNGQLYINASYIHSGSLNVGFIDFNAPVNDFDVPDENNPDTLLEGQAVVNGWIVNTTGLPQICALNCAYAKLLRGRTITLTFTFNGTLTKCESISQTLGGDVVRTYIEPEHATNPYTYQFTVPDNSDKFGLYMYCDGLKQISATVSGPQIVYPDDIKFSYAGLQIGHFMVDRSGIVQTKRRISVEGGVDYPETRRVGITPQVISVEDLDLEDGFTCNIARNRILIGKRSSSTASQVPTITLSDSGTGDSTIIRSDRGIEIRALVDGSTRTVAYLRGNGLYTAGYLSAGDAATTRANLGIGGLGTVIDNSVNNTSIAFSNNTKEVCHISLAAGTWVISANLQIQGATVGARQGATITTSNVAGTFDFEAYELISMNDTANHYMNVSRIVTPTGTTTYYLMGYAETTRTVSGRIKAVRII